MKVVSTRISATFNLYFAFFTCFLASFPSQAGMVDTVEKVTESVVAIGFHSPLDHSAPKVLGTGFVVGDGTWVATNYHVVDQLLDPQVVQYYVVLTGTGDHVLQHPVEISEIDPVHDLALLKLPIKLSPLRLVDDEMLKPGSDIAFTGFPLGSVLGLYPATHKGMVAAVTPDAIPVYNTDQLTATMMKRLGQSQRIYQLDATAYPGNSGSPVYLPSSGEVIGVMNKVIVRDAKESALSSPSGISYAVPVKHLRALMNKANAG
ncbi:serine protease [Alteromonas aestuariivivens]|uniref:Serine protease n=1 Tax=Alteromonas aestuariivivens TaxID=1938339 RepID=A0A3D8MF32_9ALTE|nr:serine protease [Alteromonas aestuariivivens]RDV29210.1 serine protease [Alteromonas aestuariivivens]